MADDREAVKCSRCVTDLAYVDPSRQRSVLTRAFVTIGTIRPARFVSRHLLWKLDPLLLRITRGRVSSTLVVRTGVLGTTGAKTGEARRNAVIYFHDGERVTIVASHAGYPRHPAWFHNLVARPDVTFGSRPMRAAVVADEAERERLWKLADRVFPPYANYRRAAAKSGRTVPIVQLVSRER